MAKDQGSKVRKKKFAKIYYLLLVPAIALGLLAIPWITSANQSAIDIKSFPEFIPDEQSVIEEGMELSVDNYLPLATTEVESGQKLDLATLPGTVKAEILVDSDGADGAIALSTDIADIAAEWDAGGLDLDTPGVYKLNLKLPGDYRYKGVLPYIAVEVKQAVAQPSEPAAGQNTEGTTTPAGSEEVAQQPEQSNEEEGVLSTGPDTATPVEGPTSPGEDTGLTNTGQDIPLGTPQAKACSHAEGCTVVCDNAEDCQHTCDGSCGGVASKEIQQFCGIYPSGGVAVKYNLLAGDNSFSHQRYITAYMTDGNLVQIPIKWVGNQNLNAPGTYTATMSIEGDFVWNGEDVLAEITVHENDESGR